MVTVNGRLRRWARWARVTTALLAACGGRGAARDAGPDCAPDCPTACTTPPCMDTVAIVPYDRPRDLDLLFVIDDTGSMAEEQAAFQQSVNRFFNVLASLDGGLPSLHVGVVSTDVGAGPFELAGCSGDGDDGVLQNTPRSAGCSPPDGSYIVDIADGDGARQTNYTGELIETFNCIARLGIDGCGFEQPLEAARRALDGSNAQNAGFLRPDAALAVVFMTDEDDCSAADPALFDPAQDSIDDPLGPLSSFRCFEFGVACAPDAPRTPGVKHSCAPRAESPYLHDVQDYVDFFRGLKERPDRVFVGGLMGAATPVEVGTDINGYPMLEPVCESAAGRAAPAVRLAAFLAGFPRRNAATTICTDDLSASLVAIARELTSVVGSPCLVGDLQLSPIDCTAIDLHANGASEALEPCNDSDGDAATNQPCWLVVEDRAQCPHTETGLTVRVHPAERAVPAGTELVVECLVNDVPAL